MLKQLIQRLLDSRTTPEEAAHSAMPSRNEGDVATVVDNATWSGTWQIRGEYIPPSDGYVVCQARNPINSDSSLIGLQFGNLRSQIVSVGRQAVYGFIPVQKGRNVNYLGTALDNVTVQFIKATGGGYNLLSYVGRRFAKCLRTSCNFFLKLFSRAKKLGSALNRPPRQSRSLYRVRQPLNFLISFLPAMERLRCVVPHEQPLRRLKFNWVTPNSSSSLSSMETQRELASVAISQKDRFVGSYAGEVRPQIIRLFFTPRKATNNLCGTGGALC